MLVMPLNCYTIYTYYCTSNFIEVNQFSRELGPKILEMLCNSTPLIFQRNATRKSPILKERV